MTVFTEFPDIVKSGKKYRIIYADPPWSYRNHGKNFDGVAQNKYDTMGIEEIKKIPVNDIAEKDSVLFCWVTFPNLQEGLDLIKAWGFQTKTLGFSWTKPNMYDTSPMFGIGFYTKSNCEVCLLAVKGKLKTISNKVSSVITSNRREHSRKPSIVRDRIVQLYGDIPRIELFSRQIVDGWDVFGNDERLKDVPLEGFI